MDKIDEILKLKKLLDKGLINESDFNKKKEELLKGGEKKISTIKEDVDDSTKVATNHSTLNLQNENSEKAIHKVDNDNLKFENSKQAQSCQPYIQENDNKQYYYIGGIIVLVIVGIIFLNRNSNPEIQVKPDNKITKIKLPPKDESNLNSLVSIDTISTNINDNNSNAEHIETDMDRNINSGIKYKESDKNLNIIYKKVMSMLSADEKKQLIKEQRKWIKKRDSICESETQDLKSGSMYSAFLNSCLTEKTEARIDELNKIINSKQ